MIEPMHPLQGRGFDYLEVSPWPAPSNHFGLEFPIEASISKLTQQGSTLYTVMLRDITERKRMLEALKQQNAELASAQRSLGEALALNSAIVESANEGIVVYDRALRYLAWNRYMVELTGITTQAALGRGVFDIFPELPGAEIESLLQRALAGETVTATEMIGRRRGSTVSIAGSHASALDLDDPSIHWTLASYTPYRDQGGAIIGVIGCSTI